MARQNSGTPISSRGFSYDWDKKSFAAEESTLRDGPRTAAGASYLFEGEIQGWHFVPTPEAVAAYPELAGATVLVINIAARGPAIPVPFGITVHGEPPGRVNWVEKRDGPAPQMPPEDS